MKIKKILSAVMAAVVKSAVPLCVNAAEGDAAFCFDNDSAVSMWQTYGAVEETGFKYEIASDIKESGNGSLKLSQKITGEIPAELQSGGLFVSADALGLDSFAGCTMQASVYFDPNAAEVTDKLTMYSDGIIWITSEVSDENTGWTTISLTIPENAANISMGFTLPTYKEYDGTVCYIDNVNIYKADGTVVENFGDYEESAENIEVSIGTVGRILLIILLAVLVVGIIAGIGFVVSKLLKKFI